MGAHKQEELYSYEEFVHIYLQDILKFHGSRFTTYSPSLQQQLRHLSFVAALINSRGQVQTVLEEHNIVKDDLECGLITWESVEYFQRWQVKVLNKLETQETQEKDVAGNSTEVLDNWSLLEEPVGNEPDPEECEDASSLPVQIKITKNLHRKLDKTNIYLEEAMDMKDEEYSNRLKEDDTNHDKDKDSVLIPVQIKIQKDEKKKYVRSGKLYRCESCSTFATLGKSKYEKHMFEEHEHTMCEVCGLNFTEYSLFRLHTLTHLAAIHECTECGEKYKTVLKLNHHTARAHPHLGMPGKEMCVSCGKYFIRIEHHSCTSSTIIETSPCPYSGCDYVGSSRNLKTHIKSHQKVLVTCPSCGKETRDLRTHLNASQCHIPEKERVKVVVKCDTCFMEFSHRSAKVANCKLKRHIKHIHEQVRDVHCDQCSYKTYTKCNLYVHVKRMHEGRPYKEQCPHCPKVVVNLEWHIKWNHQTNSIKLS